MTTDITPGGWVVMYTDGASRGNPGVAGAGIAFTAEDGRPLARGYRFLGTVTNNEAEYQALIIGLEQAQQRRYQYVLWRADSELLVQQVRGEYKVRNPNLQELHCRAMLLFGHLKAWRAEHVAREVNKEADRLANKAIDASDIRSWKRQISRLSVNGVAGTLTDLHSYDNSFLVPIRGLVGARKWVYAGVWIAVNATVVQSAPPSLAHRRGALLPLPSAADADGVLASPEDAAYLAAFARF